MFHRIRTDHAAIGNNADPIDGEPFFQPFN
ncbi:hypothetical protein A5E_B0106, partial [Vibrio cholerae B33]